jgi:hypothetical protein
MNVLANPWHNLTGGARKEDIRLPRKWNSNSHGVRPVYSNQVDPDQ